MVYESNSLTFAFTTYDLGPQSIFGKGILVGPNVYLPANSLHNLWYLLHPTPKENKKKDTHIWKQ